MDVAQSVTLSLLVAIPDVALTVPTVNVVEFCRATSPLELAATISIALLAL